MVGAAVAPAGKAEVAAGAAATGDILLLQAKEAAAKEAGAKEAGAKEAEAEEQMEEEEEMEEVGVEATMEEEEEGVVAGEAVDHPREIPTPSPLRSWLISR